MPSRGNCRTGTPWPAIRARRGRPGQRQVRATPGGYLADIPDRLLREPGEQAAAGQVKNPYGEPGNALMYKKDPCSTPPLP